MKKKTIRLTETDLHNIIKQSVNKVLNEGNSLLDVKPMDGQNYENLAKKMYVTLQNDDIFKSFINAILHFYQKGDSNRLTSIGQNLVSKLCFIADYYAQYDNRSNNKNNNQ